MKKILILIFNILLLSNIFSQVVVKRTSLPVIKNSSLEYGFLSGKEFPFYSTFSKFDFEGEKIRVELYDDRDSLNLNKVNCSKTSINNNSEFSNPKMIFYVQEYIKDIFRNSKIEIDPDSKNKIEIHLESLDSRLFGFIYIKVHGISQIKIKYKIFSQTYCCDILDGDPHSPLRSNDFVTRKTAARYMVSAAIRENIEEFLTDFKRIK